MGIFSRFTSGKRRTTAATAAAKTGTATPAKPTAATATPAIAPRNRTQTPAGQSVTSNNGHRPKPAPQQARNDSATAVTERPNGRHHAGSADTPAASANRSADAQPPAQRGFTIADQSDAAGRLADADAEFKPLRNKQELFEELQRNYREVVQLVRKVDTHLDSQDERSKRLTAIAERLDKTLPAIEKLGETPAKVDALRSELVSLAERGEAKADERAAAIERVVGDVVTRLEAQIQDQQQLVSTMAQFRQTMGELAVSNRESGAAVRELARSVRERDQSFGAQLGSLRMRVTVGLCALGVLSAAAVGIAAFGVWG